MKNNKSVSILFLLCFPLIFGGCAHINNKKQNSDETNKNPNIVYRDLTKPLPIPPESDEMPTIGGHSHKPKYFIEFENESIKKFDVRMLDKFESETSFSSNIIIFGHSHGNSGKGTLTLSSGRARLIRDILIQKGYKNVFVMAFWGRKSVSFAPTKGVQLYVLDENKPEEISLTIKKNKGSKDDEIDPSKSIGRCNYNSGNVASIFR